MLSVSQCMMQYLVEMFHKQVAEEKVSLQVV